jgi:hypothetical protein
MVAYVANKGQRRRPAIGRFGEITVKQARTIAQDWCATCVCGYFDPGSTESDENPDKSITTDADRTRAPDA